MTLSEAQLQEFDRAFGLWRGAEQDVRRAERTLETVRDKEKQARERMLEVRDRITSPKALDPKVAPWDGINVNR